MKFNKLYNLILESIINQNKADRKAMLQKSLNNSAAIVPWLDWLDYFDNKTADFLCKYIADGTIIDGLDKRINIVQKILKLNPSLDTQRYKGSLDQFIKQYETIIKKAQAKQAVKTIQYLDSIPQFTQKRQYKYGVVTYKVQNSKKGQEAVRKIIDLQWGTDANPWCLASRSGIGLDINYKKYWAETYNAYPKAIAFQNGKLLAFRASGEEYDKWWDRNDNPSSELKTLDNHELDIPVPQWTEAQLKEFEDRKEEVFLDKNNLVYNQKTDRYDSKGYIVKITDRDLIDGHFPVKFGVIEAIFSCSCPNLQSLQGAPTWITRNCVIHCPKLTQLKGLPTDIDGDFILEQCNGLVDLTGSPRRVEGTFIITDCKNIVSLKGGPKAVGKDLVLQNCRKLVSPEGFPRYVGERIRTYSIPRQFINSDAFIAAKELEKERLEKMFIQGYRLQWNEQTGRYDCHDQWGMHVANHQRYFLNEEGTFIVPLGEIDGNFTISQFDQLKSLKNGPTKVGGRFEIVGCHYLKSLQGCPREVGGNFRLVNNSRLTSLNGITQHIGDRLIIANNTSLKDSSDLPTGIKLLCVGERNLPKEFFQNDAYIALAKAGKVMKSDD